MSDKDSHYTTLAEIPLGKRVVVIKLLVKGMIRHRLLDLGLLPGTEIQAIIRSPLGSPTAYKIRGSLLALRSEDASKVRVQLINV
jgi:ferrous iron transport protein A